MITITESAKRLVEAFRARAPKMEWCVRIFWRAGDVENYRNGSGEQVWLRGVPHGWTATLEPFIEEIHKPFACSVVSDVKVCVDNTTSAMFPFEGGVIDADGPNLVLAPNAPSL